MRGCYRSGDREMHNLLISMDDARRRFAATICRTDRLVGTSEPRVLFKRGHPAAAATIAFGGVHTWLTRIS